MTRTVIRDEDSLQHRRGVLPMDGRPSPVYDGAVTKENLPSEQSKQLVCGSDRIVIGKPHELIM